MKKNREKIKEPTLLRKLLEIYYEQAKRRKELRRLEKQSWSIDFLSLVLIKAAKAAGTGLAIEITNKEGVKMNVSYDKAKASDYIDYFDDNIFNKLDDDTAINNFIRQHSTR